MMILKLILFYKFLTETLYFNINSFNTKKNFNFLIIDIYCAVIHVNNFLHT